MTNRCHKLWICSFVVMGALLFTNGAEEQEEKMHFLQQGSIPKLLVATRSKTQGISSCEVTNEKQAIRQILSQVPSVQDVSASEMNDIIDECDDFRKIISPTSTDSPMAGPTKTTTEGYDGWNVIFPGTKWCGAGDIAKNYDDLGLLADTDKCCRAHDLCNDTLAPGQTKNNLTSNSPFTVLNCKCDNDFYDCLEKVDTVISNKIGNVYFNILRRSCYELDYPPSKRCKSYRSFLKITCKQYGKNTKAPKAYQWKSARVYKKLPIPGPFSITLPSIITKIL